MTDKWDVFYIEIAKKYAGKSYDPRLKVGCVIATREGILYPGYNGDEIGGKNEPDSLEPGKSNFVHAEANAILKFNPTIHKNSKLYLTHSPCVICSRMIINTQAISHVFYETDYRDISGLDILRARGITVIKLEAANEKESNLES